MKVKLSTGEKIFYGIDYLLVFLVAASCLYPFIYILSASLSDPFAVTQGKVLLFPKGFNIDAYKNVFSTNEIWIAYRNTIWYVVVGTAVNVFMTVLMAYPLSRKKFAGRKPINLFVGFTLFFSAPLVPTFLVVKSVGLMNSMWALVIPTAIDTFYLIIVRSFFQEIPESLFEAAVIDGCNDVQILYKIIIFLSGPILAVMVLFYAVFHWNSYFGALLYLNDDQLYPLQMVLRKILIAMDANAMAGKAYDRKDLITMGVRYASIIVSTIPILCIYPFLQKYFVKGVMIGSIKG